MTTNVKSIVQGMWSELEMVIREGGRKLIQSVLEEEVESFVEAMSHLRDESGRRLVKRNGHQKPRQIQTGIGPVEIQQPRVRNSGQQVFSSSILPPYLRKVPSLENLVPVLYLKGISTGDFSEALSSILGPNYKGFSAKSVERLKSQWLLEYRSFCERRLDKKRYVYIWADGIYCNVRLGEQNGRKLCFLVLIGALEDGRKELVGIGDGYRESKLSWLALIENLKSRGLVHSPELVIGDGALGFHAAVDEGWPEAKHQRCWVHKTANVLDKMPKSVQPSAKQALHDIYLAETEEAANAAWDRFFRLYEEKYPNACGCLEKDREHLFSFYSFPAVHWQHIRSTNVIESTFATVRHRSRLTKGCGSREATIIMIFKLCMEAEKHWRKLRGHKRLADVISGVQFRDGFTEEEWLIRAQIHQEQAAVA